MLVCTFDSDSDSQHHICSGIGKGVVREVEHTLNLWVQSEQCDFSHGYTINYMSFKSNTLEIAQLHNAQTNY